MTGVRSKVLTLLVAAVLVTLVAAGLLATVVLRDRLADEAERRARAIAATVAATTTDLVGARDTASLQTTVIATAAATGAVYVMVTDRSRLLLAHTFGATPAAYRSPSSRSPASGRAFSSAWNSQLLAQRS